MLRIVIFLVLLVVLSIAIPNNVLAQSDADLKYFGKGIVTGEHFTNGIMWTGINGNQSTVIAQWDLGRSKIISDISPSSDCESNYQICVDATVTSSDNSAAVKIGDKFQIKIDTVNKKQVIIGKFGFLENVMIDVNVTKTYEKTMSLSTQESQSIAEEAFIYAYPMLENYKTMHQYAIDTSSDQYKAPFNVLSHASALYTPKDTTIISPNSDTFYSFLLLDLRTEPMVISVPAFNESRYYSFQFVDSYTHNFAYVGTRATGNDAGNYLVVGPDWHGDTPIGIVKVIQSETNFVFIGIRTQVFGPDDVQNVMDIQKQYKSVPLSQFLGTAAPTPAHEIAFPVWSADKTYSTEFINYLNLFMTWGPIHPSEKELFAKFSKIGIEPGKQVNLNSMDPNIRQDIEDGVKSGLQKIKDKVPKLGEQTNGWTLTNALGSRDFYNQDYLLRAGAAMLGIYGNSLEEASYPSAFVDGDGEQLDASKHNYVIKFKDGLPPAKAFWSITMYDGKTQLLIENTLDRYMLGSISNLQQNSDGSTEIYVQQESLGIDNESNWLPAPNGPYYLVMRLYLPEQTYLDGTWTPPAVEKTP